MSFDNWRKRLSIIELPTVAQRSAAFKAAGLTNMAPTLDDEGYYRKATTEKLPNGRNKVIGWTAIALFSEGDKLWGVIGHGEDARDMTDHEIEDAWTYCCSNPITHERYVAVVDNGEAWPDLAEGILNKAMGASADQQVILSPDADRLCGTPIPAANREVAATDNAQPAEPPHEVIKQEIDNAKSVSSAIKAIADDETATRAANSRNRLNELKLKAEKDGKVLYEPHYRQYKSIYDVWMPMAKDADDEAVRLRKLLEGWEKKKREIAAKAAADAAEAQRKIDEQNQRTADLAIAAGRPEPAPVVVAEVVAAPVIPAPKAQIVTGYGRAASVRTKQVVVITDIAAVFNRYKEWVDVINVLTRLAQQDHDAGIPVPGIKTEEAVTIR